MSLLVFIVLGFAGGTLTLATRSNERIATAVGLGTLGAATVVAVVLDPGTLVLADATLAVTPFTRLFLVLGTGAALLLVVLGAVVGSARDLAAGSLFGLGAAAVALTATNPLSALLAAGAGGFAGLLVTTAPPRTATGTGAATRQARAIVVSLGAAVVAAAWTQRPAAALAAEPTVVGLALLAIGAAVAIRFGAIPFHLWAARLPVAAPEPSLPLVLAWGPAALFVAALTWAESVAGTGTAAFGLERALVAATASATLLLGLGAAFLHDDLEHVVTYSIVADAGIALLALSAIDGGMRPQFEAWLLGFLVVKTAFAAWAAAVRATFGTRRLRDLGGWMTRSPLLAGAFLLIALATVGWPGLAFFDARAAVIDTSLGGPIRLVVLVGSFASIGYLGRILVAGLARRSPNVSAAGDQRPRWPDRRGEPVARFLARAWQANRAPIAALIVTILAVGSVVVGMSVGDAATGTRSSHAAPAERSTGSLR